MHILIISDFEGITGVNSLGMIDESSPDYNKARKLLMMDVNAAVCGAFDAGAEKVTVIDGHHRGANFIDDELDKRAVKLDAFKFSAAHIPTIECDAVFAVGAHAMAGTPFAFLDHTQNAAAWFNYSINGRLHGELGQQAAAFGAFDIPLIMVSGDEAACEEAKGLVYNIVTVSVKKAKIRNACECIPEETARKMIYEGAKKAVKNALDIKPYKISLPAELELTLYRNDYCDDMVSRNPILKRKGRTLYKYVEKINSYSDLTAF